MIDLNVRSIKSINDDGERSHSISVDRSLCTHCASQNDCKALKSLNRANKKHEMVAEVKQCAQYTFPILFVDPKGTDGSFNTIRLGTSWYHRVKPGDKIGLVNKANEVYGYAHVESVTSGHMEDIVLIHAHKNHLYLDSGMSQLDAGQHLMKKLPNIYGNMIVKNNQYATVVYLRNSVNI